MLEVSEHDKGGLINPNINYNNYNPSFNILSMKPKAL